MGTHFHSAGHRTACGAGDFCGKGAPRFVDMKHEFADKKQGKAGFSKCSNALPVLFEWHTMGIWPWNVPAPVRDKRQPGYFDWDAQILTLDLACCCLGQQASGQLHVPTFGASATKVLEVM